VATRLEKVSDELQNSLINWGYAICDASLRTHFDPSLPPGAFPCQGGVSALEAVRP
jgi:NTE family protein